MSGRTFRARVRRLEAQAAARWLARVDDAALAAALAAGTAPPLVRALWQEVQRMTDGELLALLQAPGEGREG